MVSYASGLRIPCPWFTFGPLFVFMSATTLDYLHRDDLRYTIAVLCDFDIPAAETVEMLYRRNIECVDVLYYDEDENYGTFLLNRDEEEGGIPLLFIFKDDLMLIENYDDLVALENQILN